MEYCYQPSESRLRKHNRKLRKHNRKLRKHNKKLRKHNRKLRKHNRKLRKHNRKLRKPKKKPNDWRLNLGNWGLIPKVSNFLWADFGKTPPVGYFIFASAFSPMENEELTTVPIYLILGDFRN
jgi:hypothetical protein